MQKAGLNSLEISEKAGMPELDEMTLEFHGAHGACGKAPAKWFRGRNRVFDGIKYLLVSRADFLAWILWGDFEHFRACNCHPGDRKRCFYRSGIIHVPHVEEDFVAIAARGDIEI